MMEGNGHNIMIETLVDVIIAILLAIVLEITGVIPK